MARTKRRRSLAGLGSQFSQDVGSTRWFRSGDVYARVTFRGMTTSVEDGSPSYDFRVDLVWLDADGDPSHVAINAYERRTYAWEEAAKRVAKAFISERARSGEFPAGATRIGSKYGEIDRIDRAPTWVKGLVIPPPAKLNGLRGLGGRSKITNDELENWVENDEGLYDWWKSERCSLVSFIKRHRAEIIATIENITSGRKRQHYRKYDNDLNGLTFDDGPETNRSLIAGAIAAVGYFLLTKK